MWETLETKQGTLKEDNPLGGVLFYKSWYAVPKRSDLKEQREKDKKEEGMLEYDSPSSDEESADDEAACDVGEILSLEPEANFLLGRVSRFGRSIRFNSRMLFS